MEAQIVFLRSIWETLPDRYQLHLHTVLVQFQFKLQQATVLIDGFIGTHDEEVSMDSVMRKKGAIRKLNLALGKKCLVDTINDCKKWQDIFDPSWYLILRMSDPIVDERLAGRTCPVNDAMSTLRLSRELLWKGTSLTSAQQVSIFKPADFDLVYERISIPYSSCWRSSERSGRRQLIIDRFAPSHLADTATVQKTVRDLARLLASFDVEDTTSGLLSCAGVIMKTVEDAGVPSFELAFVIPPQLEQPRSLREILVEGHQAYPLDDRLYLAKVLARSVLSLHACRFVHKNIRPEIILIFQDGQSKLGTPFLVGFETFRPANGMSYFLGDSYWERNLYRHPRRQGIYPEEEYTMQHDVYSVGVCLLEIGIWSSFVTYKPTPSPSSILSIDEKLKMKETKKKAFEIKSILTDLAKEALPSAMGHRYTEIVVSCLTCLDNSDNGFGDEKDFLDEDGILVGVRFIEKVTRATRGQAAE